MQRAARPGHDLVIDLAAGALQSADEVRYRTQPTAWGMQRGAASTPLPRWRGDPAHILYSSLTAYSSIIRHSH